MVSESVPVAAVPAEARSIEQSTRRSRLLGPWHTNNLGFHQSVYFLCVPADALGMPLPAFRL